MKGGTVTRIRVLVVDDSVVVRRLVTDILASDDRIDVVGTAANGKVALAKIPQLNPDLVTLDVEMPVMDGLTTLKELRRDYPRLPVIMFSTLTERGAETTLDALERGANDYVAKPANVGSVTQSMEAVRSQLVPKIVALCTRSRPVPPPLPPVRPAPRAGALTAAATAATSGSGTVEVLAIGASTGGPDALSVVLQALPATLSVPVVVVQHMPPVFTRQFADRLNSRCALTVAEATAGMALKPGHVLIAPGDFHLRVRSVNGRVQTTLDQGVPENYCRPAVDVLFRSVVECYGGRVLGVILTGMGADGARGSAEIVGAGGSVIAQDEATSVVWGMPGAVTAAGLASRVLPLPEIAAAISSRVAAGRSPVRAAVPVRPAVPARPAAAAPASAGSRRPSFRSATTERTPS